MQNPGVEALTKRITEIINRTSQISIDKGMALKALLTSNIILNENDAFGSTNYVIVRALLQMVDENMMMALGLPFCSTRQCAVVPTEDVPMCVKVGDLHVILLKTRDNFWCQWVYQFAHEYCHHLIDGSLSGEWSDMLWLEETICELSSLYNLNGMIRFCTMNGLQWYAPLVDEYLNNLLINTRNTYSLSADGGWYKQYEEILKRNQYQRDLYNTIAVMMYPLFIENPHLWKIILKIGDIRSWASLDDLLSHLESNTDESYCESFGKLRRIFS